MYILIYSYGASQQDEHDENIQNERHTLKTTTTDAVLSFSSPVFFVVCALQERKRSIVTRLMCCSVLQSVAECCRVLQCVAECCRVLHCIAVCYSVF